MLKTDISGVSGVTESWFDYVSSSTTREMAFEESAAAAITADHQHQLYLSSATSQLDPQPIVQNLSELLLYGELEQPLSVPHSPSMSSSFDISNMTAGQLELMLNLYDELYRNENYVRLLMVIFAYSIIFFISLFGNLMVCHIIITNRKLHTFTNCFIANLSVSDLLMTLINVPFGVTRIVLDSWPFGSFFCSFLPFIQATSV